LAGSKWSITDGGCTRRWEWSRRWSSKRSSWPSRVPARSEKKRLRRLRDVVHVSTTCGEPQSWKSHVEVASGSARIVLRSSTKPDWGYKILHPGNPFGDTAGNGGLRYPD